MASSAPHLPPDPLHHFAAVSKMVRIGIAPPATPQAGPLLLEKKVAEKLGLSRLDMRSIRESVLKKEDYWTLEGRDRFVVISEKGLKRVLEHLGTSTSAPLPSDFSDCALPVDHQKKNGAAVPPDGLTQLTVKRIYPNPRLLLAIDPAGNEVRVRVNSNFNFVPRMLLSAIHVNNGLYQMQGRCPRFKGRY